MVSRFKEALFEIENQEIMPLRSPTLEPTIEAFQKLQINWPKDEKRIALVAGTNGKGTTAAALSYLLHCEGKKVGLYTSPHLTSICERIQINGKPMSEEDFGECYFTVKERLGPQRPSHFEMLTIMAAYYFFEVEKVDYAVFEVGMGGTWDATNAIPHGVSVIAKLGFDHQHLLGNTIEEIASNKFGIIGDEGLVFSLPVNSDLNDLKSNKIKSTNCVWMEAPHFEWEVQKGLPPDYTAQTKWGELKTSMLGERALENLNLALLAFEGMGFKPEKRINALSQFEWTGRMSQLQSDEFQTPVYLSGDHNGQGIQSLISLLKNFEYENLYFVAGVGKKKDLDEVLGPLFRFVDPKNIILTTASFMGRTKEELSPYVEKAATYVEKPIEALRASTERSSVEDLIVVTGSLYLVGDVLTQIQSGSV